MRFLIILLFPLLAYAQDPRYCGPPERDADGRISRSLTQVNEFRSYHRCPSTGQYDGRCPGWAVDHVIPLACGGCDSVVNMQWLPNEIKRLSGKYPKDRWERKVYANPTITDNCKFEVIE